MFILLPLSCTNVSSSYKKQISDWYGRKIWFPDIMTDVLTGDTIRLNDEYFTIISYVNNTGCLGCKLNLRVWNEYINSLDSIVDTDINIIMIVNTKDKEELSYFLEHESYDYPVYLDSVDIINSENHFPTESTLQSFILDKNHKVIAIGNPVADQNIASLYKSILSGEISMATTLDATIYANTHCINLGIMAIGEEKMGQFQLSNKGNDSVRIKDVIPSCHCMKVSIPTDIILPHKSIECTVKFQEDSFSGEFDNTIHFFYEGFDYPSIVHVHGTIR